MATFTAIPEKTQNATAMKRVLDYVMQDKKTMHNGVKLVSGQNCVPESAFEEFMATKHQYGKAKGVFFKQYVQSFKLGYGVKWIDRYKYITYTTSDGQRFRDNRLLDDKYLKTNMEELFAYEYGTVKTNQSNTNDNRADGGCFDRTVTVSVPGINAGTVQQYSGVLYDAWRLHCRKHGFDIKATNAGGAGENPNKRGTVSYVQDREYCKERSGNDDGFSRERLIETNGSFERTAPQGNQPYDVGTESQLEAQAEMDSNWGDIAVNAAYLTADLAMIGGGENDEKPKKKKYIRERKNGQKKEQIQDSQDDGIQMNM